jgi:hypothetical protein
LTLPGGSLAPLKILPDVSMLTTMVSPVTRLFGQTKKGILADALLFEKVTYGKMITLP